MVGVKSEHNGEPHTPALSALVVNVSAVTALSGENIRLVQNLFAIRREFRAPMFRQSSFEVNAVNVHAAHTFPDLPAEPVVLSPAVVADVPPMSG